LLVADKIFLLITKDVEKAKKLTYNEQLNITSYSFRGFCLVKAKLVKRYEGKEVKSGDCLGKRYLQY